MMIENDILRNMKTAPHHQNEGAPMKASEVFFLGDQELIANICHNTQEIYREVNFEDSYLTEPFHNMLYHEVLLPEGADMRFKQFKFLWDKVLDHSGVKFVPYQALHIIAPLPQNAPLIVNINLCKQMAHSYFISKGVPVQLNLHQEDELDSYPHAHFLVAPYTFSQDGKSLEKWVDMGLGRPGMSETMYSPYAA